MILTPSNYYAPEANWAYFSASQIKSFMSCPARTMAGLRGELEHEKSMALLVGSYVDAYFEGTLDQFTSEHPEVFKRDGSLKAEYHHANIMIARAEADPVFIDVLHPDRIVDLKTTRDFNPVYKPGQGRMTFAEAYQYPLQGAIYQAVEGGSKPFYLDVITKESQPDLALIRIGQEYMDAEMKLLRQNLPYYDAIKQGMMDPPRCEHCAYCKSTRRLTGPIGLDEFEMMYFDEE